MAARFEVNTAKILFAGVVSVLLLVLIVVGVNAWFLRVENAELERKWAMTPNTALAELRAEEQKQIHTVGVSKDGQKRPTIPVETAAMMLVEWKGKLPTTQPAAAPAAKSEEKKPDETKPANTAPIPAAPTPSQAEEAKKPDETKPTEPKPVEPKTEEKKIDETKPTDPKPDASKDETKPSEPKL